MTVSNHKLRKTAFWILSLGMSYYVALLPFQPPWLPASAGMMVAGIGWLISLTSNPRQLTINWPAAWVYLCLVLLYLSGLPTLDVPEYRQIMNTQVPFLFWGLPFVVYDEDFLRYSKTYLPNIFLASSIFSALVFIVYFIAIEISDPSIEYSKRSPYFFLPVHYLSLYYNVAIVLLLRQPCFIKKSFKIAAISVLIAAVILLASRIQWVVLLFILIIHFLSSKKFKTKKVLMYFMLLSVCVTLLYVFVPEVHRRMHETLDEVRSLKEVKNGKQTNHRKFIWKEALQLLSEVPITGYKPGLADKLLMERLSACDEKFWDGEKVYYLRDGFYNYHNQFLQSLAERGVGVVFLFLALLLPVFYGRNWLCTMMVLVIAFAMLTESILQRQAGVFLVATFLPMIVTLSTVRKKT
ncbi:O-antigen ligase family protein [Schleiferia thermophila]|uniref:O-antigen ligase family protein n=1 Tax=Schleiferia thermophila TaxID=884107 RepID=UPI000A05AE5E|nr:O-antigen ligase family protein [Schleiferia thermophila]